MLRHLLRGFAAAVIAAVALGGPVPAAAVTHVNGCAALTKAGETYVLTTDIPNPSDLACFRIQADRITVDLGGHTVTGIGTFIGAVVWDEGASRINTVVKNGTTTNFGWGVFLAASTRSTVRNITASGNAFGIEIGSDSLVKDCIIQRNELAGIVAGDRVQVENCLIGGDADNGNGGFGLVGGQRMLVTRNTASGNDDSGILVGMNSTVTHNTANDNGNDGIAVGQKSLVTYNTANDNEGDGIEAVCPATVTNNQASGNGDLDFNFIDIGQGGCFDKGNTSPAPQ